jgi:recombination protein RecR
MRIAYHLVTTDERIGTTLARAIDEALSNTALCQVCFSLTEVEVCQICSHPGRDRRVVCVVEKPADVIAIERSGGFGGVYHVLHGLWSPLKGMGFEKTKMAELFRRIPGAEVSGMGFPRVEELVLATGTTVEGDATALYIAHSVKEENVAITRIAQGLPKGGELEYADEVTLSHAISGRRTLR